MTLKELFDIDEETMDDPNRATQSATPHLGVEFCPPDPDNGDMYGVKSVWSFSTRTADKKKIYKFTELEPKYRNAIIKARKVLAKAGLFDKLSKKEDWRTVDLSFTGNGQAIVNFDDPGLKPMRIDYEHGKILSENYGRSKKVLKESFFNY